MTKELFRKTCTMQNPEFKDCVLAVGTFAFFLAVLLLTGKYGGTSNNQTLTSGATSKTYPYIIGTIGVVTSLWLFISKFSALVRKSKQPSAENNESIPAIDAFLNAESKPRWKMVCLCIVMMFVLNILLIKLGVIVGGFLYLIAQILILNGRKNLTKKNVIIAVIISICVPLLIYFPFTYIFKAKIPMGIFS